MGETLSPQIRSAPVLVALRRALAEPYGPRLKRAELYGSRPRGDARADSDWDVAVFLDPVGDPIGESYRLADIGTDLLETHGEVVHAFPFPAEAVGERSLLMRRIRREGVAL
jgi:predicted nucleotidyltransferase